MAVTRSSPAARRLASRSEAKYDLVLNDEHVNAAANDTFEKSGIAKNAREEKIRARDAKIKQDAENARMAKLYRKEVLGEPGAAAASSPSEKSSQPPRPSRPRSKRPSPATNRCRNKQQEGRQQWRPFLFVILKECLQIHSFRFSSSRVPTELPQPLAITLSLASRAWFNAIVVNSSPLLPRCKVALTFCDPIKTPVAS